MSNGNWEEMNIIIIEVACALHIYRPTAAYSSGCSVLERFRTQYGWSSICIYLWWTWMKRSKLYVKEKILSSLLYNNHTAECESTACLKFCHQIHTHRKLGCLRYIHVNVYYFAQHDITNSISCRPTCCSMWLGCMWTIQLPRIFQRIRSRISKDAVAHQARPGIYVYLHCSSPRDVLDCMDKSIIDVYTIYTYLVESQHVQRSKSNVHIPHPQKCN